VLCRVGVEVGREGTPVSLRKVIGDASESGILRFCEELRPVDPVRAAHPKVVEMPFNSTNKYQVSVHEARDHGPDAEYLIVMKGAPERIVSRCSHCMFLVWG
jgi:sodium/potassium-transporting ATPase subunit alpha